MLVLLPLYLSLFSYAFIFILYVTKTNEYITLKESSIDYVFCIYFIPVWLCTDIVLTLIQLPHSQEIRDVSLSLFPGRVKLNTTN